MSTATPSKHNKSIAGRLLFSIIVLAIAAGIFLFRQELLDQINFRQFSPSEEMSAVANQASLTSTGKFYLYASRPELQDREAFSKSCGSLSSETTAVLGCYSLQRIYLFDIDDSRLDGIKEVTAAHEMLHAVYERMSSRERSRIDDLLSSEAEKISDSNFTDLMTQYDKTEPGQKLNELHSIIPTQIETISPELESYYRLYFSDRSALVRKYKSYETVFTDIRNQQEQLSNELSDLEKTITSGSRQYNADAEDLNERIQVFNRQAQNGSFSSQAEFDRERNALLSRQQQIGQSRAELDGYIATYNTKRQQLIELNGQADALNRSINSQLTPLPSL